MDLGNVNFGWFGDLGTLAFPDERLLASPEVSHDGELSIPALTHWQRTDLVLSNAWLRVAADGFRVSLTNDLVVKGAGSSVNRLELTNATVTCGGDFRQELGWVAFYSGDPAGSTLQCRNVALSGGADLSRARGGSAGTRVVAGGDASINNATWSYYFPLTNDATLSVAGSMVLTNSALFRVYGGLTNGTGPDYGGRVDIGDELRIAGGCWIHPYSHPANGGSALFRVGDLTVAAGGGIDAHKKGYPQGNGAGTDGLGPGKGKGGWNSTGAGYGGLGGKALTGYGQTYGSSNAPVDPGSAGGLGNAPSADSGGLGGGVIRIEAAGTVTLDGTLNADGGDHTGQNNYGGGGGAGGSIYVQCRALAGNNPVLSATGGVGCDNRNTAGSGGGGGGRIAVWRTYDTTVGATANVDGGAGYRPGVPAGSGDENGAAGTIVWGMIMPRGTVFVVR
jgi:hypothetical protein